MDTNKLINFIENDKKSKKHKKKKKEDPSQDECNSGTECTNSSDLKSSSQVDHDYPKLKDQLLGYMEPVLWNNFLNPEEREEEMEIDWFR